MVLVTEGTVSNLEIQPTLMEQIKKAQQGHPSIEGIKKKITLVRLQSSSQTVKEYYGAETDFAYLTLRNSSKNPNQKPHRSILDPPWRNQNVQGHSGKILVARYEKGYSRIYCLLRFMSTHKS